MYQRVLIYRNYTNHASKLPQLLLAAGVPQLSIQNIQGLLCEMQHCIQEIQALKKEVPEEITERSITQTIVFLPKQM